VGSIRLHVWRVFRFALVGAFCFAVQYSIMILLAGFGVDLSLGNAVGFVVSAQVNFLLSAVFTWGGAVRVSWLRWASYNSTALLGLAVNTTVFGVAHGVLGPLLGAAVGVGAGAAFTYLVCNFLIFRQGRQASAVEVEIPA
jgi:putative flippase GtrA